MFFKCVKAPLIPRKQTISLDISIEKSFLFTVRIDLMNLGALHSGTSKEKDSVSVISDG